ncbi:MAG TPA: beta-propeller fold lactonase family protein [Acidobacteriaceae bacterium]|nr:beta-propeller fold lactonase family protein [Acidobacteriaceae bacterium]
MTYKRMLQAVMAAGVSVAIGLGLTACSRDYTAAYVYSISASGGNINGFGVDYQTGILTQIAGSPFATNFQSQTAVVRSPDGKFIYVVSGPEDSKVVELAVGTDGKLYGQHTYSLTGTYPTAAAIDSTGKFLYVTFTYQTGFTPALPGLGGITIFPIKPDNTLDTPVTQGGLNYVPVGNNPVGIAVSVPTCTLTPVIKASSTPTCAVKGSSTNNGWPNAFVYVVDQEASPNATVLGFAQNVNTGTLTMLSGTTFDNTLKTYQGVRAGVAPSAVAIDPTGRFVYVTDKIANQVIAYSIDTVNTGNLTALRASPFPTGTATGQFPVSLTIDPRGKYLYTTNFNSSTLTSFTIDVASGNLSAVASSTAGNFTTGPRPTCVTIEPALGTYIYTSNLLDGTISAGKLNPNTGAISGVQNSPFTVSALPSCIISVPNGEHSIQLANP